ncbi:MAG: hypothetical protein H6613_17785 [Ignavibacteriales bacterium]|nr:hypothetical protein [Ignavibacteriales bacterium]
MEFIGAQLFIGACIVYKSQKYSSSIDFYGKTSSFSVRCIKDDGTSSSGNQAPNIPSSPNPSNGAKDQPTNVSLFWTCNDPDGDPLTYDIYFGTNNVPPLVESNHSGTSYNPGTLEGNTQYYWEIVAKDNNGNDRTGPDWEFTTGSSTSLGSSCPGIPTVTYAGKTYNTVQIGEQCWLKENLNVGTLIDQKVESMNNSIIEKFCYNNEEANCEKYGGLYQWAEAMEYLNSEGNKGFVLMAGTYLLDQNLKH